MLHEQTFDKLYALQLTGMAEALKDQMGRSDMDGLAFEERFSMLVDAQHLFRENKRMKRLLENAKLKLCASMEDIDYRSPRGLDKSVMLGLGSCDWVKKHRNVIIVGSRTARASPSSGRAAASRTATDDWPCAEPRPDRPGGDFFAPSVDSKRRRGKTGVGRSARLARRLYFLRGFTSCRLLFRFIVSPEDAEQLTDLTALTR